MGEKPFKVAPMALSMSPNWMYIFDSSLALKLKPGEYTIDELNEYHYNATIDTNGFRVSPYLNNLLTNARNDSAAQIIFLGAGSTFGQGLSDTDAYVYALQKLMPQFKFRNQAVMGYGVPNNFVQVNQLKEVRRGDLVIYIYHADQDNRYSLKNQKSALNIIASNKSFTNYHYLTLDSNLTTHLHKYNYTLWPLSEHSALINYLENAYNNFRDSKTNNNSISRKAILAMHQKCTSLGLRFWVVCWKSDQLSLETLDYLNNNGVKTMHVPVVIGFDHIPKSEIAKTNKLFADSLAKRIAIEMQ